MSPIVKKFVVLPAVVLAVVTAVRAWLQVNHPHHAITPLLSVVVVHFLMAIVYAPLLLRRGLSYPRFVGVLASAILLVRLPIAIVYGLAWANHWTEAGTDTPVRYIRDFLPPNSPSLPADAHALVVFAMALLFPVVVMVVLGSISWLISWAVAFRGKRPLGAAAAVA